MENVKVQFSRPGNTIFNKALKIKFQHAQLTCVLENPKRPTSPRRERMSPLKHMLIVRVEI